MSPKSNDLKPKELLERWLALRNLSAEGAAAMLGVAPGQAEAGEHYGGLDDLTALSNPAVQPGTLYFRNGQFALFYIEDLDDDLATLTPASLRRYLGGEGEKLRSRAGKRCFQHVYAEQGIAFSACEDEVNF